MSAESGYLRTGATEIRGYSGGDVALRISPTAISVNGHVTTVAPTADLHASTKLYVDTAVAGAGGVTSGAQTWAGVKTFTSSPIVPTPTTDYQASTKKYVDDTAATETHGSIAVTSTGGWTGTGTLYYAKAGRVVTLAMDPGAFTAADDDFAYVTAALPAALRPSVLATGIGAVMEGATPKVLTVFADPDGQVFFGVLDNTDGLTGSTLYTPSGWCMSYPSAS